METGEAIRLLRLRAKLSQVELSAKAGVDRGMLSEIESGKRSPSENYILKIADALKVPYDLLDLPPQMADDLLLAATGEGTVQEYRETYSRGSKKPIPVISWASAGEGMVYLDQGRGTNSSDEWVDRPANVADRRAYAVRVAGDSMVPVLNAGDIVVIDHTKTPVSNDLVLVKLKDYEVFVKFYGRQGDSIVLRSSNPLYEPIVVKDSDLVFPPRKVAAILKR